ncbi:Gfo/Idh/MocA family oxidoreductase [Actinocorallia sp. A-T 12471]|uniref:Gfo/Idh/MocA family oxidoreductase n=1 Tax=Actinocorallia sp. A-T 12471 TaxID=3089813 RepID=UPI0029D1639D|nr:Gfo/Idh/MocA family oxidoreductase [Actinocorallia sp. A-T 12471]MDX6739373.1 Gfo/Idh/MocA family oxidoreductase [Actinocorallia sp. A-T 12471]
MSEVAVGLVGAGPWANMVHAPAIAAGPGTRLAGVWARRPEAAAELAGAHGTTAYASLDELFASCEAVAFAVPPNVQAELALKAVAAGKAVLLEKPLAMDLEGARGLAEAIAEAGVVSQMVFSLRYTAEARAFLRTAADLEVFGGYGRFVSAGLSGGPFATPWRLEHGALLDLGPHVLDMMDASLGRIVSLRAHGHPLRWLGLLLEHEGGAVSEVSLSMAGTDPDQSAHVEVFGARGEARIDWHVGDDDFTRMITEFAEAVRTGVDHPLNAAHGLHIQTLLAEAASQLSLLQVPVGLRVRRRCGPAGPPRRALASQRHKRAGGVSMWPDQASACLLPGRGRRFTFRRYPPIRGGKISCGRSRSSKPSPPTRHGRIRSAGRPSHPLGRLQRARFLERGHMSRITKFAVLGAASAAAVALTAAPAQAAQLATGTVVVKVSGSTVATCSSTLSGDRTGSSITVTSATATGCGVPVSPASLPWSGNIAAPATMSFAMSALGCTYSGTLTGGTVSGTVVTWTNQSVSGTGWFCSGGVTVDATYNFA